MKNNCCYKCKQLLTLQNRSKEHIIPDALGGKGFTSSDILCKKCNSEWGSMIDNFIIDQLGSTADIIGVKRDRPNPSKRIELFSKSGKVTWVHFGGKKAWEMKMDIRGISFSFKGISKSEVEKQAFKKLTELKGKFSDLDVEKMMTKIKWENVDSDIVYWGSLIQGEKRKIWVGGDPFFRALTKIAVNFALVSGIELDELEIPLSFLVDEKYICHFFQAYFPKDQPYSAIDIDEISHVLYLKGDSKSKLLYCYIELFNSWNFIGRLASNYYGPDIERSFLVNVLTGKSSHPEISIPLSFESLYSIPSWSKGNHWNANFQKRMQKLVSKIEKHHESNRHVPT